MKEAITRAPFANPYAALGLTRSATADEIKQAYFSLVRQHPPERDPARFKEIRAAYDQLKSPDKRLDTDMRMWQAWTPPPLPEAPDLDLDAREEDVLLLLRACSDLEVRDLRSQFREVRL
jgi:curved DNA-binding protein CbpA